MATVALFLSISILEFLATDITAKPIDLLCPPDVKLTSCTCKHDEFRRGAEITCKDIVNPNQLEVMFEYFDDYKIYSFMLRRSILSYLPGGLFFSKNLQILRLQDVTFQKLLPHTHEDNITHIFSGTESSLEKLSITANSYDFSLLELGVEMVKLKELTIVKGEISHIEYLSGFAPNLEQLVIERQNAKDINDTAFSKMLKLKKLQLSKNEIVSLKREMLPNPANELYSLDLCSNKLRTLPENMFEGMPKLRVLILQDNSFYTLQENVMKPIWENLISFTLAGNTVICDEHMKWISKQKTSARGRLSWGVCYLPQEHRDKKLEDWSTR